MANIAMIIAGGSGNRMHQDIPKQFLTVNERPVIIYTLQAFEAHPVFHFDFNRANYSESIIDTDVNPKTGEREISSAVRRSVQSVQPSQRFCQRGIRLILVRVGNTHFPH